MTESSFTYPSPLPLSTQPVPVVPDKAKSNYLYWSSSINTRDANMLQSLAQCQAFLRECNIVESPRPLHVTNWFHGSINQSGISSYESDVMKNFENLRYMYSVKSRGPMKVRVLKVVAFPGRIVAARVQVFEGTTATITTVTESSSHSLTTTRPPKGDVSCPPVDCCQTIQHSHDDSKETIESDTSVLIHSDDGEKYIPNIPMYSDSEIPKEGTPNAPSLAPHHSVYDDAFSLDYLVANLCPHMTLNSNYDNNNKCNSKSGPLIKASNSNELIIADELERRFGPLEEAIKKEASIITTKTEKPSRKTKNNPGHDIAKVITSQQLSEYIKLIMLEDTTSRTGNNNNNSNNNDKINVLPKTTDYVDTTIANANIPLIKKSHAKDSWYPGYYTIDAKSNICISKFLPKLNIELIVHFRLKGMRVWVPKDEIILHIDELLHC